MGKWVEYFDQVVSKKLLVGTRSCAVGGQSSGRVTSKVNSVAKICRLCHTENQLPITNYQLVPIKKSGQKSQHTQFQLHEPTLR